MSCTYSISLIDEIKSVFTLEDAITKYVYIHNLKTRGNRIYGLCPLPDHTEKTPSWSGYLNTNSWYCFGCHQHGDPLDLVAQGLGMPLRDAIKLVANDLGLQRDMDPRARQAIREQVKKRELAKRKELAIKQSINNERRRLIQIEKWVYTITKHICCDEDLYRPVVARALKIKPLLDYYIDVLINGTFAQQLEVVSMTKRWDPWEAL